MLTKEDSKNRGTVDISDLDRDWMVRWQHRNYPWVSVLMGFVFPTFVAGVGWGDWAVSAKSGSEFEACGY
jgi:stearoyl-CoA desaturase (delta-9 desaturase)